ncbi:MAG TPA: nucleotidyltransferase domain-containing protein [Clostridiaceae bacterium]
MNTEKIKEIMTKTKDEMNEIYGDKLKKVILYGSYARQEQTEESDIDVMVLVDEEPFALKKYEDSLIDFEVDMNLDYDIVLSIYTKSLMEYQKYIDVLPYLKNISREGIVYYG